MVRLQRLAQRVHIMACISIICCTVAAQQSASAQVSGGVQIVWQKPMDRAADICALTAGGRWAMTATGTGTNVAQIRIRDMETGEVVRDLVGPVKLCIVFGKDSTSYMTVSEEKPLTISTISTSTGIVINSVVGPDFYGAITAAYPFADRERWVVCSSFGLYVFNTRTRTTDTIYSHSPEIDSIGHSEGAWWIGVSNDEAQVYSYGYGARVAGSPYRLCAWNVATRKLIYQKEENKSFVFIPVSYPRGEFIVRRLRFSSYSDGSHVEIYDLRTGELDRYVPKLNPEVSGSYSLTADRRYLALQLNDSTGYPILFVDTETGVLIGEYKTVNYTPVIQFLPSPLLDLFLPRPDINSLRLRIDPTTDVKPDASGRTLQCSVLPNPGDGSVAVSIILTAPAPVMLRLAATDGKVAQESDLGMMDVGTHTVPVRAAAGYYQCTVTAGRASSSFLIIIR